MAQFSERELFETVPVPKAVATLAIPTVISQVVTMIYNLADTFFIGQTGDPLMVAAVSLVSPWFNLLTALGNLFGLGRGIAKAVLRRGDWAAVTARDPAELNTLAQAYPERVLPLRLDMTDRKSMEQAVHEICQHFGSIDVLVNNACHGYRAALRGAVYK